MSGADECDMCGCRRDVHRNLYGRCLEADEYGPCGCRYFLELKGIDND